MGYDTRFGGSVTVDPPLNAAEVDYLRRFARTRHMERPRGLYFVDGAYGRGDESDVPDPNRPAQGLPNGFWCDWEPTDDGTAIEWNGVEKFYLGHEWMATVIDHFLRPGAHASTVDDPQFAAFTFDHVVNGTIEAQGEDADDRWDLVVIDNVVRVDRDGDRGYNPVPTDDVELTRHVLSLPMRQPNDADAATIGDYLTKLLALVWEDRDGFDGKRPFGNSSWEYDLYRPLIDAGHVRATFDEDGYIDDFPDDQQDAADALIATTIQTMAKVAAGGEHLTDELDP